MFFVDTSTSVDDNGKSYILHAKIKCGVDGGNDDAHNIKVIVLLPAEVNIENFQSTNGSVGCIVWDKPPKISNSKIKTAMLTFSKDSLNRNSSFDITVQTSKSSKLGTIGEENFAVMVYSQSPDKILCDNYWYQNGKRNCDDAKKPSTANTIVANTDNPPMVFTDGGTMLHHCLQVHNGSCEWTAQVPHDCEYAENCLGCGGSTFCQGKLVFSNMGEFQIFVQELDNISKQYKTILTAIRQGKDKVLIVPKNLEVNNLRFLITSKKMIEKDFNMSVKYTQ